MRCYSSMTDFHYVFFAVLACGLFTNKLPYSRTDIYSLGILFYMMLCGEPPFIGDSPLDVMQNVLSKRIPPVSSKRMDLPEVLSHVIQRMTQKNIEERYHSTSGLKYDLVRIRELLSEGDGEGLKSLHVGTKDISCFFNLPTKQIGREKEHKIIVDVIERVSKLRRKTPHFGKGLNSLSSSSSYSDPRMEATQLEDIISDSTSSRGSDRMNTGSGQASVMEATRSIHHRSQDSGIQSDGPVADDSPAEVRPHPTSISRFSGESQPSKLTSNSYEGSLSLSRSNQSDAGSLLRSSSNVSKLRRRQKCEVIAISAPAGLGKSRLVQSIQTTARSHGYFASAKFDATKRAPFDPILKLMSSLFRQIFSEADVSTEFHNNLRNYIQNSGVWSVLHNYLDLPEWLLSPKSTPPQTQQVSPQRSLDAVERTKSCSRRGSSPSFHCGSAGHTAESWVRSGGASKSSRFMNIFIDVLRLLAMQKLCIWSLEDVQNADSESAELIHHIVSAKIPIVMIITYQDEEKLAKELRKLLLSVTKIVLSPFTEMQTAEYVAETLHRDQEYILPLVAVIQEKSRGNLFYIREILDTCYRKHCVYYCWREGQGSYYSFLTHA
jgi:hypothetical protein